MKKNWIENFYLVLNFYTAPLTNNSRQLGIYYVQDNITSMGALYFFIIWKLKKRVLCYLPKYLELVHNKKDVRYAGANFL